MFEDFFIERLTSLRNQKNVSAREMSLALGQNGSYINRIENRLAFPSMQVFFYRVMSVVRGLQHTPMYTTGTAPCLLFLL